ncbi:hypothetical protein IQ266_26935, partial [filamentous cyanobacterium LEGE 11480]
MSKELPQTIHSRAWVMQAWTSLAISLSAMTIGIIYLPVNGWI